MAQRNYLYSRQIVLTKIALLSVGRDAGGVVLNAQ
jgi:hypothetical protein